MPDITHDRAAAMKIARDLHADMDFPDIYGPLLQAAEAGQREAEQAIATIFAFFNCQDADCVIAGIRGLQQRVKFTEDYESVKQSGQRDGAATQRAESIKAVNELVSGPVIENHDWDQGVCAAIRALKAQQGPGT